MKTIYTLSEPSGKTCVALGFFDGIHLGHQAVIKNTVKKAKLTGTIPTVFTFSQNPKDIIENKSIKNIITQHQKEKILYDLGIELLYCIKFEEIMNLSPVEFIEHILFNTLQAKYVFCGFNFHFGKNASADSNALANICKKYNIETHVIEAVKINGDTISSSKIRNSIINGDFKTASEMIGYNLSQNKI